ncbi:MAG: outer membrane beta-barrel family protein [Bacteroidota bacterium]
MQKRSWMMGLILCLSTLAWAQGPKGILTGTIVDEASQTPLGYATIALLSPADSSVMEGTVTDLDGNFRLEVKPGTYLARLDFLSYNSKFIPGVVVNRGENSLGTLTMTEQAVALEGVEVRGERSRVTMALDKKMYSVGDDLANIGGSVSDALNNIPSITVDVDGGINLRGSSNVRILINGKPSGLAGLSSAEALQTLPSDIVERVEVITNPSARYDAEGQAGIINIILKKEKEQGFNGSINLSAGWPWQGTGSINANYRLNKVNIFGLYSFNYRSSPGGGTTSRTTTQPITETLDQVQLYQRANLNNTFRGGLEYFLNDYNTLSGSVVYRLGQGTTDSDVDFFTYDADGLLVGAAARDGLESEDEPNLDVNLNYTRTFAEEGRELTAQFQYGNGVEEELSDITEQELSLDLEPLTGVDPLLQRSYTREGSANTLTSVDYIHPFPFGGTFEAGYRGTTRNISNRYLLEQFDATNGWETLNNQADDLSYDESIQAGYVIYGQEWEKISLQGGLRAEYTDISITSLETSQSAEKNYLNFFPSAFFTYQPNAMDSWQVSYSRRVRRPRFRQLNPFSGFFNSQSVRLGNPDLNPVFTHSMEVGYLRNGETATLMSSVYYRQSTGVVEYITTFQDSLTVSRPVNLAVRNAYGLEIGTSVDATNWLRMDADLNFFRAITEGTFEGQEFNADAFSWSGRFNANMRFKPVNTQVVFNYRAPQNTTQGRRLAVWNLDLVANKDILDKKGTLSLRVRDVFNTRIRRSETIGEDFFQTSSFQWRRGQQVTLSFVYRINQKNRERNRGRGRGDQGDSGSFDDEDF